MLPQKLSGNLNKFKIKKLKKKKKKHSIGKGSFQSVGELGFQSKGAKLKKTILKVKLI